MPKHLHLVHNPRTHSKVACKIAKDNLALIHPITRPKGFSQWAAIIIMYCTELINEYSVQHDCKIIYKLAKLHLKLLREGGIN